MVDGADPKYKPKRYYQRSNWACDECKLRKKKCDGNGLSECSKCKLYGKTCTYQSKTRPSQPPTQRIRELEDTLRSVRDLLNDIRPGLSSASAQDVDSMLERLRPAGDARREHGGPVAVLPAAEHLSSPSTTQFTPSFPAPEAAQSVLQSMLVGRGRLLQDGLRSYFHGSHSGAAFICSILEFFPNTDAEAIHPLIVRLYDVHEPVMSSVSSTPKTRLPTRDEASILIHDVLAQSHPFLQFLNTPMTWQIFESLYSSNASTPQAEVFFNALLALAYLTSPRSHSDIGCSGTTSQALAHSNKARLLLNCTPDDLVSLSGCLCMAVYLLQTSRLSEAYTCMARATTSAIKQGLHVTAEVNTAFSKSVNATQKQVLTTLVNIDLYISTTLGLPPLINIDTAGTALNADQAVTSSVTAAQSFFGDRIGRQNLQTIAADFASRYCQIVSLTASVLWGYNASSSSQDEGLVAFASIDPAILAQAENDIALWTNSVGIAVSPSTTDVKDVPASIVMARQHLELAFCWSQLLIYSPFLHYLRPLAAGLPLPEAHSRAALTCLKIAVNTIIRCDNLLQILKQGHGQDTQVRTMHPSNWSLIYSLFLAVVMLIFLISLHDGTSRPSQAWQRAQMGIKVLMALKCTEGGASRCLAIIQELVRQLNYTVDFDFVEMESTTTTICQHHRNIYEKTSHAPMAGDLQPVLNQSLFWIADPEHKDEFEPFSDEPGTTITPDELLARASAIPLLDGKEILDQSVS